MELRNKKINFLGDSITEGCGASHPSHCFCSLIEKETGAICKNYGIGGTRIAPQRKPSEIVAYDLDYCRRVFEMEADADIVVVFGGTNDYGHGDAPIGNPTDRTPETFYGALHTLCQSLINRYPTSTIIFLTPLHRANEDNPRGEGRKETNVGTLKDYVNIIREVTEYYSLPVLDLYANSGIQPEIEIMRTTFMPDGVHPSDEGHKRVAQRIIAFLNAL